jgi:hypothetical protein
MRSAARPTVEVADGRLVRADGHAEAAEPAQQGRCDAAVAHHREEAGAVQQREQRAADRPPRR